MNGYGCAKQTTVIVIRLSIRRQERSGPQASESGVGAKKKLFFARLHDRTTSASTWLPR